MAGSTDAAPSTKVSMFCASCAATLHLHLENSISSNVLLFKSAKGTVMQLISCPKTSLGAFQKAVKAQRQFCAVVTGSTICLRKWSS